MDSHQSGKQHRNYIQPHLGSKESKKHVSQNHRLLLHVPINAYSDCRIRRSFYFHEYYAEANRGFSIAGSYHKISDTAYPFRTDLVYVYRALHLYAQHEGKV